MKMIVNNYETKEVIRIVREWCEYTQEEFGKEINKSRHTVQSYELGRNKISFDTFMEYAKKNNIIITLEKK